MNGAVPLTGGRSLENLAPSYLSGLSAMRWFGYCVIILLIGGFSFWASTAPIAGAVIVEGQVTASNRNITIQHLEGGIVEQILVQEGERVQRDQPVYVFDDTNARIQLQRMTGQLVALKARRARLESELAGMGTVEFDPKLMELALQSDAMAILDKQRQELSARGNRQRSELEILNQRITALVESIEGYESQMLALDEQIDIVGDEVDRKKELLDRGLTNRSEYTELLRSNASLVGQRGSIAAQIATARTQIIEAREQIVRQQTGAVEAAATEINEVQVSIEDLNEQMEAAQAVLERTTVRTPSDGIVIQLATLTPGAVIPPGGTMATILPVQGELIVDGRMKVNDIDLVALGQDAQLQFLALNQRVTPSVPAKVTFVSPDAIVDDRTGESYYVVRLTPTELPQEVKIEQIYPGMPVSALISTPDRTFFEYLAQPIMDSLRLAFREE